MTLPPLVDERGDINLHGRQGAELILEFYDENGVARDMSAATVTFEVGPSLNYPLAPVAGVPSQMKLTLANADVKDIFNAPNKNFIVLETVPALVPTPHWVGMVYVSGWIE